MKAALIKLFAGLKKLGKATIKTPGIFAQSVLYFLEINASYISSALIVSGMYVCLRLEYERALLSVPIAFLAVAYVFKVFSDSKGTGSSVPIPNRRYTYGDAEGMVMQDIKHEQEALLYLYSLENYMERTGRLQGYEYYEQQERDERARREQAERSIYSDKRGEV